LPPKNGSPLFSWLSLRSLRYVNDNYGIAYKEATVQAGLDVGVEVFSAPFEGGATSDTTHSACLAKIKEDSNDAVNAFILVVHGQTTNTVDLDRIFEKAAAMGMVGEDNVWTLSDGISSKTMNAAQQAEKMVGNFRVLAMSGSSGDAPFDKLEAAFGGLDDDEDFMQFLSENALEFVSDGGDKKTPAGLDLTDYHSVDPEFFENRENNHTMGEYEAYVLSNNRRVPAVLRYPPPPLTPGLTDTCSTPPCRWGSARARQCTTGKILRTQPRSTAA
jgi:hypothetical protein